MTTANAYNLSLTETRLNMPLKNPLCIQTYIHHVLVIYLYASAAFVEYRKGSGPKICHSVKYSCCLIALCGLTPEKLGRKIKMNSRSDNNISKLASKTYAMTRKSG